MEFVNLLRRLLAAALCFAAALAAFGALPGASPRAQAQPSAKGDKYTIIHSYHNDVSPALRDMEPWPEQKVQLHEAAENPQIVTHHVNRPDTVVQESSLLGRLAPSIPSPILNFAGIPFPGVVCSCAPPDTDGEVGATQFVQMVNEGFQVFNKTTGASILGPNSISSVWSGFGGVCQNNGDGDPIVVYDQLANRWIISQFAGSSVPTDECVAVSTTNDATGTWNRYGFHLGTNFFDYPKISVWPDAYYMSMNVFNSGGSLFLGPQAFALDRTNMLAGNPATVIAMPILGSSFPPMLPADLDGSTLPPAGAPDSFVLWPNTTTYRVYHFSVGSPFGTSPTFALFGSSTTAAFTTLCSGTRACVPESGGEALDGLGDRLMFRLAYRNFGDHESLVGNFTVFSGGVAGIRWFELRGVTAGPVATFQEGTYQPADTLWRWMGSIAMDQSGDMALGFSTSSSAIFPQVRYTGRLVTDPLNTLPQGEATLFAGTGAQASSTGNRWGDYSDMTVDPVDDCTFWYTQEYYATTSSFNWRTRIGSFKFASCGPAAPSLVSAASRLTHPSAGTFDINMPLTGTAGIEDRSSATYNAVFNFGGPVTSGNVTVTVGTATPGTPTFSGNSIMVPLTGVTNAQTITLHVANVNGSGLTAGDINFSFLIGDTNGDGTVNSADVGQTKSQSGSSVDGTNFREDVNVDGTLNSGDVGLVKSKSGTSLP